MPLQRNETRARRRWRGLDRLARRCDRFVREGWEVRVLDNLEPQTHRRGRPSWINDRAEFIEGRFARPRDQRCA